MSSKSYKGSASANSSVKRSSDSGKDDDPPVKKKVTLSFGKGFNVKKSESTLGKKSNAAPLSIKLATTQEKVAEKVKVVPKSKKAAAVFNESSDSEPEEMPMEARMRMRNIGRETPTSSGPNSFNKGKLGFVDNQKSWELQQN